MLYGVVLVALAACAPFFRYVTSLGDEGVLLHAAVRILEGEVLYRDIFGILPPGGYLIVTGWMKLFGVGFSSVRALAVGLIVGIAALVYVAARLSSSRRSLAALVAITWVVLSQGALTVVNHHWLTTAASMASGVGLLLGVDDPPRRGFAFAAGLFAGTAAMVTSSRGALLCAGVLAALATLPGSPIRLVSAMAGMALVPTMMVLHVAASAGLAAAVDDVIRYPTLHYAGIQAVRFGAGVTLQHLALVALFPMAFILAGAGLALERLAMWREPRFRVSLALAIVGLLGCYPRPDHVHIAFAVPLAGPLFALSVVRVRGPGRIAVGALLIGLCLGLAGPATTAVMVSRSPVVATARGDIVPGRDLSAGGFAALVLQIDRIPSGDAFFFYPYSPLLPYLTGRRHTAAVDVLVPGYTSVEHFRQTCVRVVTGARWVIIDRQWSDPSFLRKIFPGMRDPDPPEKHEFESALRMAFGEIVHASPRFEVRRRSGDAPTGLCDKI